MEVTGNQCGKAKSKVLRERKANHENHFQDYEIIKLRYIYGMKELLSRLRLFLEQLLEANRGFIVYTFVLKHKENLGNKRADLS